MQKASVAFRKAINNAIIAGSGVGQPQGLLTGGVARCLTSPLTPPGSVTWQDAFQLMMQLPAQWHDGAVYLANQNTIATSSRARFRSSPSTRERRIRSLLGAQPVSRSIHTHLAIAR